MRSLFDQLEPAQVSDFESQYTPRPYQLEAKQNAFSLFEDGKEGALIRLNTGGGKTFIGSWIAKEWIDRSDDHFCIVIAHERQLVTQFAEEIHDLLGITVGIEMATDGYVTFGESWTPKIIVASRATLMVDKNQRSRLFKFDNKKNWLQIHDECHRWSYRLKACKPIVDWFAQNPESKRLGLSATPERGDGVSLERLYPGIALDYKMYDINGGPSAVNDGWAVPYDQRFVEVAGVDFKNLREVAGDFQKDELEEILNHKEQIDSLIKPTLDLVGQRRTILFNPGVAMAESVANAINAERAYQIRTNGECIFGSAASLDGSADDVTRKRIFGRHQSGEIQFLSVCGLCREGYNDPGIQAVAVFRPTKSRSLAEQMKGRGCRPLKGTVDGLDSPQERRDAIAASDKPNCMVVDLVGITGLADVASTASIMADGKSDDVIKRANENALEKDGPVDMSDEIRNAEQELDAEEKERLRIQKQEQDEADRIAKQKIFEEAKQRAKLRTEVKYDQRKVSSGEGFEVHSSGGNQAGVMTFGKHKGEKYENVPRHYLNWCIENINNGKIQAQCKAALDAKSPHPQQENPVASNPFAPATEKQKRVLEMHGYSTNVTSGQAGDIIMNEINKQLVKG